MDKKEEEFLKRLQDTFRVEAEEHIRELTSGLIELEKAPKTEKTSELIEKIFREAHSLKGASRSVNMKDVESICQILENIFEELKNERISLTAEQYDLIHKAIDNILKMISSTGTKIPKGNRELIKQLQSITEVVQSNKINEVDTREVKKTFEESATAPSESG